MGGRPPGLEGQHFFSVACEVQYAALVFSLFSASCEKTGVSSLMAPMPAREERQSRDRGIFISAFYKMDICRLRGVRCG